MNSYTGVEQAIIDYQNTKIKHLMRFKYSGKGRPKNSDYIIVKIKDLPDIQCAELLENAFTTTFITK